MMPTKDTEKLESLIGAKTDLKGEVNVKGTLQIEGLIHGKVNADCVILSESAVIQGDITAKKITVNGKVEGKLRTQEIVEIKVKGKVMGEIYTPKFSMAEGGKFNGKIEMKIEEGKVIEFETKSQGS